MSITDCGACAAIGAGIHIGVLRTMAQRVIHQSARAWLQIGVARMLTVMTAVGFDHRGVACGVNRVAGQTDTGWLHRDIDDERCPAQVLN